MQQWCSFRHRLKMDEHGAVHFELLQALLAFLAIMHKFMAAASMYLMEEEEEEEEEEGERSAAGPIRRRRRMGGKRFWSMPGRSSTWWDNFEDGVVDATVWRKNFRMTRSALIALSEELRPHIERQTTNMRASVGVLKMVACTLYYLREEGRLRTTANAFGRRE